MVEQNGQTECLIQPSEHLVLADTNKRPIQRGWQLRRPSYEEVKSHVASGGFIGVIPHSIGLTVVDCDSPEDEQYVLKGFPNIFTTAILHTRSQRKIGDWHRKHLWIATDHGFDNRKLPTKGDIRGANGFIVLYRDVAAQLRKALTDPANSDKLTSEARERGNAVVRQLIGDMAPEDSPISLSAIPPREKSTAEAKLIFEEGSRNDTLYKEACKLYEQNAERRYFIRLIERARESGLSVPEVKATLESARKTIKGKVLDGKEILPGNVPELINAYKAKHGKTKDRTNKKSSISKTVDWLEEAFPGLEFVRAAGTDSDQTGYYPIYWRVVSKSPERGRWVRPKTNEIGQLIQIRRPEMKSSSIREVIYQLSLRENKMSHISDWDVDSRYMGLADGMLWDFKENTIVRQTQKVKISIHTPTLPRHLVEDCSIQFTDVDNPKSLFEKCLIEWMTPANGDKEILVKKMQLLQMIMGYSLQAGNKFNYVFFHWGQTGGNGKSVFMNAIRNALGEEAAAVVSSDVLMSGKQVHDTMLNRVVKARIGISEELEDMRKLNVPLLKKLSGNDHVIVRSLRQDARSEVNQSTIHIPTNPHPSQCQKWVDDPAWRRRAVVIPWEFTVTPDKMDPNLDSKLKEEADLILDWLLVGWMMYAKNDHKLEIPQDMRLVAEAIPESTDIDGILSALSKLLHGIDRISNTELAPLLKKIPTGPNTERIDFSSRRWSKPIKEAMTRLGYKKVQYWHGSKRVWGYQRGEADTRRFRDIFGREHQ